MEFTSFIRQGNCLMNFKNNQFVKLVQVFEKSYNSPVLVTFASEPTPIWEIPFPALTICNMNKVDSDKAIFYMINLVLRCEHLRLRKFSNI